MNNQEHFEFLKQKIENTKGTFLDLSSQDITDDLLLKLVPTIEKKKNLTVFYLHSNNLTIIPSFKLPNLQQLWISNNQIKKLENLNNLSKLRQLVISGNQIAKL